MRHGGEPGAVVGAKGGGRRRRGGGGGRGRGRGGGGGGGRVALAAAVDKGEGAGGARATPAQKIALWGLMLIEMDFPALSYLFGFLMGGKELAPPSDSTSSGLRCGWYGRRVFRW